MKSKELTIAGLAVLEDLGTETVEVNNWHR
jgi:hypothetical protein